MALDKEMFAKLARDDFEFTRETRYFNGTVKLEIGDDIWALNFNDGELLNINQTPQGEVKVVVGGTSDQWDELLQDKPRPFYQCIQSAAVKEGMWITNTHETFAYLPAVNRLTALMRQMKNRRASHYG